MHIFTELIKPQPHQISNPVFCLLIIQRVKMLIFKFYDLIIFIQGALLQVSQAAAHANDSMKRIEQFKKLLEVQESIGGGIDLVSPTREVLKEGKMVKISARTGDHQDRYLFLVTKLTHNPMNWKNFIFFYFS